MHATEAITASRRARTAGDGGPSGLPSPRRGSARPARHWWWFALPAVALTLLFFALPFVANAFLAFTQWTGFSNSIHFNGLDNFRSLISLGILGHATLVTIVYALVSMVAQNTVGLCMAKALQWTTRTNTVFRSIFFIPVLFSPLAAGYIWAAMLDPHGPVNGFIGLFVPGFDFAWLGHPVSALVMVGLIDGWKMSGLVTLVYIAGLNSINRSVIEASVLDGATGWRRFRSIEMPLLAPAFTFNIVVTLIGAFSALDIIFSTTKGGPGDATAVLNVAVYNQYGQGLFGTSSALSFMIAVLVIVIAVPLIWWLRRREVHE